MEINYKKCPHCGSLNVVRILYGMPTHEAFLLYEEGKIKLGGCCITDSDPEYFCKDCEHEWDKQEALNHAYNEIKGIKASVGGYFSGYYEVEIDFESRLLTWSHFGDYYEKTIRKDSLVRFIKFLKMINVLNWKSRYIEPGICDGTQWSIELKRNGRNIRKYGDNKFPDGWDEFCRLIRGVSGKSFS